MKSAIQSETTPISPVDFPEDLVSSTVKPTSILRLDSPLLNDIKVTLEVRLGRASMSVQELLSLKTGATLSLDVPVGELVEVLLNQSIIARGEIVAVGDQFGIRVVEILETK